MAAIRTILRSSACIPGRAMKTQALAGPVVSAPELGLRRQGLLETPRPRLRWVTQTEASDWTQVRAEVELTRKSGREVRLIEGSASVAVPWPFPDLAPRERASCRVRVTGSDGIASGWSPSTEFMAGHLSPPEWNADFIVAPSPDRRAQPVMLRRSFEVGAAIRSAILYASAQGVYQVEINGTEIDNAVLKPGWTAYESRLGLESTDVTELLRSGQNAIGIHLAGGWFAQQHYGDQPSVAAQLVVELEDGTLTVVATDGNWRATTEGPIRAASIYDGETHDFTRALPGWSSPGFDDTAWTAVVVRDIPIVPESTTMPPTLRVDELPVESIVSQDAGRIVVDFGQNVVGWARIRVAGPAGTELTLRYAELAEMFDDDALFDRIMFSAKATDNLVLDGTTISWEPRFTFHGFRFLEITGWPGDFDLAQITAVVIQSAMARTGWFASSSNLLDRLHENIVWSMRGNFLSLPTDCPQRAERRGWTGDLQLFAPSAATLFDCEGFLRSWLVDLEREQRRLGTVPVIVPRHPVPDPPREYARWRGPTAGWSDAATIVPSVLYDRFGDVSVLADQLGSMIDHVESVRREAGDGRLWLGGYHFGDWLDPTAPPETPASSTTDNDLIANAYFARSAQLLADAAAAVGREDISHSASELAAQVRNAWCDAYVTPAGRLLSDSQTAYALAIEFGLYRDGSTRTAFGVRLADLVEASGYTIATGLIGTPIVANALTSTDQVDTAAKLLLQTRCPSWLYPVTMGATTMWERWDSLRPDGRVNSGRMTSFNHYVFGAVADWLHRTVAGLGPAEPGYRRLLIAPQPLPGLEHALAGHMTPYGYAESSWAVREGAIEVRAIVPPNTKAQVRLPWGASFEVGSGHHAWTVADTRGPVLPPFGEKTRIGEVVKDPAYDVLTAALTEAERKVLGEYASFRPDVTLATVLAMQEGFRARLLQGLDRVRGIVQ